jgi:hypothetical protein
LEGSFLLLFLLFFTHTPNATGSGGEDNQHHEGFPKTAVYGIAAGGVVLLAGLLAWAAVHFSRVARRQDALLDKYTALELSNSNYEPPAAGDVEGQPLGREESEEEEEDEDTDDDLF